jgi:hypothetical protein
MVKSRRGRSRLGTKSGTPNLQVEVRHSIRWDGSRTASLGRLRSLVEKTGRSLWNADAMVQLAGPDDSASAPPLVPGRLGARACLRARRCSRGRDPRDLDPSTVRLRRRGRNYGK